MGSDRLGEICSMEDEPFDTSSAELVEVGGGSRLRRAVADLVVRRAENMFEQRGKWRRCHSCDGRRTEGWAADDGIEQKQQR
ncbi:UNVERIFIED_CONTAM: hypothetical protein Sradi_2033200 [Sesamum radiatum]|uniref:Uncharacterized protein n=1 Tax=Sesamum radiatum TaxID=300843 RepID=A0AAW2THI5_SESRA